jgi:hypothetical protein
MKNPEVTQVWFWILILQNVQLADIIEPVASIKALKIIAQKLCKKED